MPTTNELMKSTIAFATYTGVRRGTAANDERIMPVEYSPEIASTPSTATMSWPKYTPNEAVDVTKLALAAAGIWLTALSGKLNATSEVMPRPRATTIAYDQNVERNVR